MEVSFRKAAEPRRFPVWVARKGKTRIAGSIVRFDPRPRQLPHDIVTLVVERELGLTDGFFATVAAGGTFRSMAKRRSPAGKGAIAPNRPGLQRAEHQVHREWDSWLAGRPTPCRAALDEAWEAWEAVAPGGELTLSWPTSGARPKAVQ